MYKFEIMRCDWYKRRNATEKKAISNYFVDRFKKKEDSSCTITVKYDDDTTAILNGRVCCSRVYNLDNTVKSMNWTINGISPFGDFILLKILDV
tara:strand:+ start:7 stop:288 length:282 start_codon:yes stop_codon:yes gene_type:complete